MERLSDISCYAALGIDNYILKKATEKNYEAIKKLREYLEDIKIETWGSGSYNVGLALTFWEAFGGEEKETIQEVAVQTSLFKKTLESIKGLEVKDLKDLRDFCTNLSKTSMKYEEI